MRNKKAIGIILAVIIAVSVFTVAIPGIASESSNTIVTTDVSSASKAKSVLQIENVKSNLTDAQKKLSTDLLQLVNSSFLPEGQNREFLEMQMKRLGQFRPASSVSPASDGRVAGDLVYVYVYLKPFAGTQNIEPYVWEITDRDEENHLAVAWVEVKNLETLASLEAVRTIRTVMPPQVRVGSVTTEGDAIHRTYDVRTTQSQNGSGVKVGIISDGVDNRASAQSSGDLPASLIVLSNTQGGDEGTAMLEIVHDMVPGADLYFHDCGANTVAFNAAIDALVAAGCDVVCDDIGWLLEPFFEDGIVASHLTSVLASNDIVYASSAGNAGNKHYQGDYYNDSSADPFHDFSRNATSDDYLYVNIPNNGEVTVVMQWNDEFGLSGNNYDLLLFNTDGWDVLAGSIYPQNGDDDPVEAFTYTNTGGSTIVAKIDVYNYNGAAATKTLEVFIYPGNGAGVYTNNIDPVDSIFGHAAVPDVIAVGAIDANDPGNDDIEPFSSQGPVTISYPSPVSRAKPDLCGIDGVLITGAGGFGSWDGSNYRFYGTSAAAPHVAAIAAQLWGAFPSKTGNEISNALCSTAVDLGSSGYDYIYGSGRADALNAYEAVTQPDIYVNPASFDVTLPPDTTWSDILEIGNAGNANLTYSIIDDGSWLDEDPKSGSVEPGDYDEINVTINTTGLSTGDYYANITISNNDPDENPTIVSVNLTVCEPEPFDTGPGTYPSIMGTHNGTITPNQTINVSKMYTYPCTGTGGHSEYVVFYTDTAGTGTVLIIDDDNDVYFGDDQSVDIFSTTFKDMGYDVTIERSDETSDSTWSDYDIVVWSCGDDLTPIYDRSPNPEYKKMLVDYVTDGGHLILESGHIATWIKRFGDQAMDYELRKKVLHATTDWVYCDVGDLTLSTPHPIKTTPNALPDTIGFTPTNPGDDSGDADAVRILPNATGVYNWSSVAYMGNPVKESVARISYGLIAYDNDADVTNGGQIVYYAFDIDDIDNPDIQRELIENSENWLRVVKGAEIANGTWTGYQGAGDYHYIEFEKSFVLEKDVTYNYSIQTGSYPQIHHTPALPTVNGWINCTKFTDANDNEYTDWIPAIRLE